MFEPQDRLDPAYTISLIDNDKVLSLLEACFDLI